uniref:Reverse transcriptase domain-containing protein n=1 Tax=Eptatretus burgeri TaxID=7764 RepID=A0A8C4NI98_EPTBU
MVKNTSRYKEKFLLPILMKIWYVGRGRWVIPNDIYFPGFEVRVKVTKVVKVAIFKTYLVCHFRRYLTTNVSSIMIVKKHYRYDRHPHMGVIFYINDLDSGVKSRLSKFADDTKLGGEVDSRGDGDQIKETIDTCIVWEKDWQIEFNLIKWKVFGMGKNNKNRDYMMQGVIFERVTQEKDLGVAIDMGGKHAAQCQAAIVIANRVLGCIHRGVIYKSKEVVLTSYRNLVRPHLEYCVQNNVCTSRILWSLQLRK